jgi:hypothetical protein
MVTGYSMYYGAKTHQFMMLIQCVCVFWIANILLWFAVCVVGENNRSICTDSPSSPPTRPVKLNWLQVKSKVELATLGRHELHVSKMFGQTLRLSSLHQNKFISLHDF